MSNHTCELTATEMYKTLTGWDEIAIRKAFGANITDFTQKGATPNPMMFGRALVFVDVRRRTGVKDAEAYATAMGHTVLESSDYFADDPDDAPEGTEVAPVDEPVDAEGNDATPTPSE